MKPADETPTAFLGIDVAKEKMDVLLLVDQREPPIVSSPT